MKKSYLPLAIATLLVSFTSCRKDDSIKGDNPLFESDKNSVAVIKAFFDKNRPAQESFTLDASAGGVITLASGTKITFPAGSFADANGNPVSGTINISAKDVLKASDMILGNKPTATADGQMLLSFGEIIVKADKNGAPLQLNRANGAKPANVAMAVGAANGQQKEIPIWRGDTTISSTSSGYNHENQYTSVTTQVTVHQGVGWIQLPGNFGSANATTSYFNLDSLGTWRNVDVLYSDPRPKTTVLGYFGSMFNTQTGTNYSGQEPSMLFFKVKNSNTLLKMYNVIFNPAAGKEGLLSYQNMVPIGLEGTFLAISAKNNKLYAEMRDETIAAPASGKTYSGYTFSLSEVSESQLMSLITQMNSK